MKKVIIILVVIFSVLFFVPMFKFQYFEQDIVCVTFPCGSSGNYVNFLSLKDYLKERIKNRYNIQYQAPQFIGIELTR